MINRLLMAVIIAIPLSACGTSPNREIDAANKAQNIDLNGFSINVLNNRAWLVASRTATTVQLVSQGRGDDETYGIQIWSLELQQFNNDEEFLAYVRAGLEKNIDKSRFVEMQNALSIVSTRYGQCVQFSSKHQDLAAKKRTIRMDVLILRLIGISCRDPKKPSTVAHVMYSQRYYPEDEDQSLPLYANAMFQSITFKE